MAEFSVEISAAQVASMMRERPEWAMDVLAHLAEYEGGAYTLAQEGYTGSTWHDGVVNWTEQLHKRLLELYIHEHKLKPLNPRKWGPQETVAKMQAGTPLAKARAEFYHATARIEQAAVTVVERRQMEFEAVIKIAKALGVELTEE